VGSLKDIVVEAMSGYAVKGLNGSSVLTMSADQGVLAIISTALVKEQHTVTASLIVRVENDRVFIDHDINTKPLVDALVQAGIPRSQISLAGEPSPETIA